MTRWARRSAPIGATLVVATVLYGAPAEACFAFRYVPVVAEGRSKIDTAWRPIQIKAAGENIRIEAPRHLSRPAFRLVGNLTRGDAALTTWSAGGAGRMRWVSLSAGLSEVGLSDELIGRVVYSSAPLKPNGRMPCYPAAKLKGRGNDPTVCVLAAKSYADGYLLPAFATSAEGSRLFELTRVQYGPVPVSEFVIPQRRAAQAAHTVPARTWSCKG